MTRNIYDQQKEVGDPRVTRVACKSCGNVYVRPYGHYGFDLVFIAECREHEGWEPEWGEQKV